MSAGLRVADVGDDPIAIAGDWKQRKHTVRMPVHVHFIRRRTNPGQMDIRQDPTARQRLAFELHAEAVTHGAVGAIAADQPGGLDGFLMPVWVAQDRRHTVAFRGEASELDLSLHLYAEGIQVL